MLSLQINSLALNNYFSYRNGFQNGVNALSKMVLKNAFFFVIKLKISCSLDTVLFKFHLHAVQTFLKKCMERLKTFNVSISNGSTEKF